MLHRQECQKVTLANSASVKKTMNKWLSWVVLFAMLLVTACRDDAPTQSLSQQIKTLEDSGAYPKLDRSTDLKGPDQNLNGVRDDVEAWINAQPITDIQKKALMQKAEVYQKTLSVDLTNKAAVIALDSESMASTSCVGDLFARYDLMDKVKAITFNTKERTMRYI
ncbi:MAG TPA: hypothetical protein PK702_11420, partial [Burkholderiaceae bacterium]|nr:hypothetical protein [Burkholderiaceae bacterium]